MVELRTSSIVRCESVELYSFLFVFMFTFSINTCTGSITGVLVSVVTVRIHSRCWAGARQSFIF